MKRWAFTAATALTFLLIAAPSDAEYRGSDPLGGLLPERLDGLAGRYPLSAYSLDSYVDAGFSGLSNWGAVVSQWLAGVIWTATAFFTNMVIGVLVWAFSLGLLDMAIAPVAKVIGSMHEHVFTDQFLLAAISVAGIWATWKLAQRRHTEMLTGLGLAVAFAVLAMFFVLQPTQTVRMFSTWTDDLTLQVLSGGSTGTVADAKRRIADRLFDAQIVTPWVMLEFGSFPKHCVDTVHQTDGWPTPVKVTDPNRTICRSIVKQGESGHGGYAPRFLHQPAGSDARRKEYKVLAAGSLAEFKSDPQFAGYAVDRADAPAVDIQQAGGATQRVVLAVVIALAALGFILLVGALAFGVILAQVLFLAMLVLSPVMLFAAMVPGPGHALFVSWFKQTSGYMVRKIVYALAIVVVLTVGAALVAEGMWGFVLQAAFYWLLVWKHKAIVGKLTGGQSPTMVRDVNRQAKAATAGAVTAKTVVTGGVAAAAATIAAARGRKQESALGRDERVEKDVPVASNGHGRVPADSSSPPASAGREHSPNPVESSPPSAPTRPEPEPAPSGLVSGAIAESEPPKPRPRPGRTQRGDLRNFDVMTDGKLHRTAERLVNSDDAEAQEAALAALRKRHPDVNRDDVMARARKLRDEQRQK